MPPAGVLQSGRSGLAKRQTVWLADTTGAVKGASTVTVAVLMIVQPLPAVTVTVNVTVVDVLFVLVNVPLHRTSAT